jgi:hypothetical protein
MNQRIFTYTRNGIALHADPVAVHRAFTRALGGDPEPTLKAACAEGDSPADRLRRLDAEEKLAAAARTAFDLPAFDPATGQGCMEDECLDVLWDWLAWLQKKSVTTAPTPTSPPSTAPASSTCPKSSVSACGSTSRG